MAQPGANLPKWAMRSFAPDLDSTTPGVLLDGSDFYPTRKGMRALPSATAQSDALPEQCRGAASLEFTDGTGIVVAGTQSSLNWFLPTTLMGQPPPIGMWTPTGIGDAPIPTAVRWRFAIFNDQVLAVDGVRLPYVLTPASSTWTQLTSTDGGTVPVCSLVSTSDFYIFFVEAKTATWWAMLNPTHWLANQPLVSPHITVTAPLDQTSGPITAMAPIRSAMVLYKQNAVYIGTLGGQFIWNFVEVSRQTGTVSQETLAVFRDVHYFIGPDDFYSFDGFSLIPLPNDLKEWFFQRIDYVGLLNVCSRVDPVRSCIFWHFRPLPGHGTPTDWICFNVREQRWSKGVVPIDCAVDGPITAQTSLTTEEATSGFITADHDLHVFGFDVRTPAQAEDQALSVTTGDIGDRHFMYQLTRARPLYAHLNGLPTCTPLNLYTPGGTYDKITGKFVDPVYVPGATVPLSADGWFNLNNTARLQRLRLDHDDDAELIGLELDLKPVGEV